jgi:uncharacterized protein
MSGSRALAELGGNGFTSAQIASTLTRRAQQLILLPTERCNFRCTYCYEDFALGRMSEATQAGIERFLTNRMVDLSHLTLSWFGGEPLVAKDIVLRLSSYAHRLCEVAGVEFHGGLTTNAFLLRKSLLEDLLSFRQTFYQITLDGFGQTHDLVRKRAGGKGSFDRIWANLLDAKTVESDFHIQLRIHVRRENVDDLPVLMRALGENFGEDKRYTIDFEHLRNLGGDGGRSIVQPMTRAEMKGIEEECRDIYRSYAKGKADFHDLQDGLVTEQHASNLSPPAGSQYICYAAKANSLLIRSDGRIGKCTVALDDDRNTIGRIREDGTVELDNEKLRPWLRGLDSLNVAALACPLSGLPT